MSIPSNKVMTLGDGKVLYDDLRGRIEDNRKNKAPVIISNAFGRFAEFTDGADGLPIENIEVGIEVSQAGSGDPSPTNVRDIGGRTSASIGITRKNLLGGIALANAIVSSMPAANIDTTEKTVTFAAADTVKQPIVGYSSTGLLHHRMTFKENTQYTFIITYVKPSGSSSSANLRINYTDGTYDNLPNISSASEKGTVIAVSDEGKTIRGFAKTNMSGNTQVYYEESGIFEGVLTVNDFVAFDGEVYAVDFPEEAGTVYGGKLKINKDGSGKLIVDREYFFYDGSEDEEWTKTNDTNNGYFLIKQGIEGSYGGNPDKCKCNIFKWGDVTASTTQTEIFGVTNSSGYHARVVKARPVGVASMTTEQWKAYISEHNMQVVVHSTTPVEYDLTCDQISSMFGLNIVYADCGDVSVQYRADTKLFIDKYKGAQDVQLNGISILDEHGVANVPLASSSAKGVASFGSGLYVGSSGHVVINQATLNAIKGGAPSSQYTPITPANQHNSVFYALAKLAGADMAQSSNPVGQYTDDALVKIQKMLGVYEAPWELIREETVTNETASDIDITVDGNGESYELTNVALKIIVQPNIEINIGSYGTVRFYWGTSPDAYQIAMLNNVSGVKSTYWYGSAYALQENGVVHFLESCYSESGNNRAICERSGDGFLMPVGRLLFNKIKILNVQGSIKYYLYGKRKWN